MRVVSRKDPLGSLDSTARTICLVTPAPPESRKGNRVTAERWAGFLREVGHHVEYESVEARPVRFGMTRQPLRLYSPAREASSGFHWAKKRKRPAGATSRRGG